mmetsp:Transcript_47731/g.137482  ORF Transcript_47731/g.137482 Transcript_47731/m.137482 type:complete len:90 (+) Transcript_47731:198-467(+)
MGKFLVQLPEMDSLLKMLSLGKEDAFCQEIRLPATTVAPSRKDRWENHSFLIKSLRMMDHHSRSLLEKERQFEGGILASLAAWKAKFHP